MGENSGYFPPSPREGEKVSILVNSSGTNIGEDRVITFKATGLKKRKWEIEDNEPVTDKTLSKASNVDHSAEKGNLIEHKHRRA